MQLKYLYLFSILLLGQLFGAQAPHQKRKWQEISSPLFDGPIFVRPKKQARKYSRSKTDTFFRKIADIKNFSAVDYLNKHHAKIDVNNQSSVKRLTPLMLAAINENAPITKALLGHKADPNLRDRKGATALFTLLNEGGRYDIESIQEILHSLIKAKADPNIPNKKGKPPLLAAIEGCHVMAIDPLLQAGADHTISVDLNFNYHTYVPDDAPLKNPMQMADQLITHARSYGEKQLAYITKEKLQDHEKRTEILYSVRDHLPHDVAWLVTQYYGFKK